MSYWAFVGFVTGLLAGLGTVAARVSAGRKCGEPTGTDELTEAVYQRAAAMSLSGTGILALAGWSSTTLPDTREVNRSRSSRHGGSWCSP